MAAISLPLLLLMMSWEMGAEKDERPIDPGRLTTLINEANHIVVKESPLENSKLLFESTTRKDLDALSKALVVIKPEQSFHCMCIGTEALYLYKDKKLLATVTNHHGQSVRCSLWKSDAPLADIENWLKWFDDRKIDTPRKEVEEARARQNQGEIEWKKWVAAIPKGLKKPWMDSVDQFGDCDLPKLKTALNSSIPKKNDQIIGLMNWYGSGAGPWSGYSAYESAPEEMLLDYSIAELVAAIEIKKMTPAQLEGAARLLGGWDFSQKHPGGREKIPAEIRKALWEHVKDTKDEDKLGRAKRAFKPKDS